MSSNKPTGAVLRRDELARLTGLCRERALALVVDKVFGAWRVREDPELVASAAGGGRARPTRASSTTSPPRDG